MVVGEAHEAGQELAWRQTRWCTSRWGEEVDEEVHAGMQKAAQGARRRRVPRQHCGVTRGEERWAGWWTSRIFACTYRPAHSPSVLWVDSAIAAPLAASLIRSAAGATT